MLNVASFKLSVCISIGGEPILSTYPQSPPGILEQGSDLQFPDGIASLVLVNRRYRSGQHVETFQTIQCTENETFLSVRFDCIYIQLSAGLGVTECLFPSVDYAQASGVGADIDASGLIVDIYGLYIIGFEAGGLCVWL